MSKEEEETPPLNFPLVAALFEGGLAVAAVGLGWLVSHPPLATFQADVGALGLGIAATIPMLLLLVICLWSPWRACADIRRTVDRLVVPMVRDCTLPEIMVISLLAGIGEETLFRGVLQATAANWLQLGLGAWDTSGQVAQVIALLGMALLFGLLHGVSRSYAVLAGLIGVYLGWLWLATGNLLVPLTAHALYDVIAMIYLVKIRPIEPIVPVRQ